MIVPLSHTYDLIYLQAIVTRFAENCMIFGLTTRLNKTRPRLFRSVSHTTSCWCSHIGHQPKIVDILGCDLLRWYSRQGDNHTHQQGKPITRSHLVTWGEPQYNQAGNEDQRLLQVSRAYIRSILWIKWYNKMKILEFRTDWHYQHWDHDCQVPISLDRTRDPYG